jgi:hypothetical protein
MHYLLASGTTALGVGGELAGAALMQIKDLSGQAAQLPTYLCSVIDNLTRQPSCGCGPIFPSKR